MTAVLACLARKGGVGKTSATINLAAAAALAGYHTLIVQSDGQQDTSRGVGLEARDDFYQLIVGDAEFADLIRPVPAAFTGAEAPLSLLSSGAAQRAAEKDDENTPRRMVERMKELDGYFDLVIADTSPGTTAIHSGWLLAADAVLLPMQVETYSVENSLPEMLAYIENAQDERVADFGKKDVEILGILPTRYSAGVKESQRLLGFLFGRYGQQQHVFEPLRELTVWGTAAARAQSIYAVEPGGDRRTGINKKAAIKEFSWVAERLFDLVERYKEDDDARE